MKCSRKGSAWRSSSSAASPPRSRRKQHDQVGGQPVRAGLGERRAQAAEHHLERHAVVQVGLRVAEDLRPPHPGRRRAGQVRRREVVEVLLGPQHREVGVVDVEERLQVAEVRVPGGELGRVVGGQRHAVAAGQGDQQVGLERAFDVQVEFGERQHPVSQPSGQPPVSSVGHADDVDHRAPAVHRHRQRPVDRVGEQQPLQALRVGHRPAACLEHEVAGLQPDPVGRTAGDDLDDPQPAPAAGPLGEWAGRERAC